MLHATRGVALRFYTEGERSPAPTRGRGRSHHRRDMESMWLSGPSMWRSGPRGRLCGGSEPRLMRLMAIPQGR